MQVDKWAGEVTDLDCPQVLPAAAAPAGSLRELQGHYIITFLNSVLYIVTFQLRIARALTCEQILGIERKKHVVELRNFPEIGANVPIAVRSDLASSPLLQVCLNDSTLILNLFKAYNVH